jgi:hypothetical protein
MAIRLIKKDYDPVSGFTDEFWYEEPLIIGGPGKVTIRRLQDVEATLDNNKELYKRTGAKGKGNQFADSDGMHQVAKIPLSLIEKWMTDGTINWYKSTHKERAAILNNRDFRHLRVRPGTI